MTCEIISHDDRGCGWIQIGEFVFPWYRGDLVLTDCEIVDGEKLSVRRRTESSVTFYGSGRLSGVVSLRVERRGGRCRWYAGLVMVHVERGVTSRWTAD